MAKDNFFNKIGRMLHESAIGNINVDLLKGFHVVDNPIHNALAGRSPKAQVDNQVINYKSNRDYIFSQIDQIRNLHLASTIKRVIIADAFNAFNNRNLISIIYRDPDNKKYEDICNEAIKEHLEETQFLDILKDCVSDTGFDYGEIFLSTDCRIGEGIVEVIDDRDVHEHLAIYRGMQPIGYYHLEQRRPNTFQRTLVGEMIKPDEISHFMISMKKVSLDVQYTHDKKYQLEDKVRCGDPLLGPVTDLILEYYKLERLSFIMELVKAMSPILVGMGVSSASTEDVITKQLQDYTIQINQNRNTVLNSLHDLDNHELINNISRIVPIAYTVEEGINKLDMLEIKYPENEIAEKLNNQLKMIAKAVPVPENYLASTNLPTGKDDNIITSPQYSGTLSSIQQLLSNGIVTHMHKNLRYKLAKKDSRGDLYLDEYTPKRSKIEVRIQSTTNLNEKLEMDYKLMKANGLQEIVGIIDNIGASPNIPYRVSADGFEEMWNEEFDNMPIYKKVLEFDPDHDKKFGIGNEGDVYGTGTGEGEDVGGAIDTSIELNKQRKATNDNPLDDSNLDKNKLEDESEIRDIFK